MTAPIIRLAIVDDHRMLLDALSIWIGGTAEDISIDIAVPTWPDLLIHPLFPVDVVLLDLDLKDGLPVSMKLRALGSAGVVTVLMSSYSKPALVHEALSAGALGYVVKSEEAATIVDAIRAASRGERYVSDDLDRSLDTEFAPMPRLSTQERRVMALYGGGESIKRVARSLTISEETTKTYLRRIREKYREMGIEIGTKVSLRKRAIHDGILIRDE